MDKNQQLTVDGIPKLFMDDLKQLTGGGCWVAPQPDGSSRYITNNGEWLEQGGAHTLILDLGNGRFCSLTVAACDQDGEVTVNKGVR